MAGEHDSRQRKNQATVPDSQTPSPSRASSVIQGEPGRGHARKEGQPTNSSHVVRCTFALGGHLHVPLACAPVILEDLCDVPVAEQKRQKGKQTLAQGRGRGRFFLCVGSHSTGLRWIGMRCVRVRVRVRVPLASDHTHRAVHSNLVGSLSVLFSEDSEPEPLSLWRRGTRGPAKARVRARAEAQSPRPKARSANADARENHMKDHMRNGQPRYLQYCYRALLTTVRAGLTSVLGVEQI